MATTATAQQSKQALQGLSLKQTAGMVAKDAGFGTVKAFFEANKNNLAAVLPKHISADRLIKIALSAMRTTPKLMLCTNESLMGAIVQCAQLGLEPNTPLGHAYLIPFERTINGQKRTDVQIIIGYKGFIDLARRSGQIVSIAAHAVYAQDVFDFCYGLDEKLEHKPALSNRGGTQDIICFYAVAKLNGGGHAFEVMSKEQVERIRDGSQNWQAAVRYKKTDSSPWSKDFEEMGRKTVIRRLFKYLPSSIEMADASALDEKAETAIPDFSGVIDGEGIVFETENENEPTTQQSQNVDQETGEVTESTSQQSSEPSVSNDEAEKVKAQLFSAKNGDALDIAADLIASVHQNFRADLYKIYEQRKKELLGSLI